MHACACAHVRAHLAYSRKYRSSPSICNSTYMLVHAYSCAGMHKQVAGILCLHILILQHTLVQLLRHAMCANCLACSLFVLQHAICNVHNEVHAAHAVHDMQLVRHVACASHGMYSSFSMHLMQCVPHATRSMRIAQLGQHTACSMQCMHAQRMLYRAACSLQLVKHVACIAQHPTCIRQHAEDV